VFQLKAKRQEEGEHKLEKRLAITKQLKVGGFVLEIESDRPIFAVWRACLGTGHPHVIGSVLWITHLEGNL
jgi:hypothetical protein